MRIVSNTSAVYGLLDAVAQGQTARRQREFFPKSAASPHPRGATADRAIDWACKRI